jgi:hypothetical protein
MIPVTAAVLASIGDLLLLLVAHGARTVAGWPRASVLVAGHYLGVLTIPLYALGYRAASRSLPPWNARVVAALGAFGGVVGAAIHGITAVTLALEPPRAADAGTFAGLAPVAAYLLPLWTIAAAAVLAASLAFALPVLRGDGAYPRWLAALNPVVLVLAIGAAASVSPWSRAIIAPAAPNLAHVVFFALVARFAPTRFPAKERRG